MVLVEIEAAGLTTLIGHNARKQLIFTGVYSSGQRHDLTHDVKYSIDATTVVSVDAQALVAPISDGTATITAKLATGQTATLALTTSQCAEELPVAFENEYVPIFTKRGCNAGGCHGKADGQDGFRLSLPGFHPKEDYEYLVYEDRGRHVPPADLDFSLLLTQLASYEPNHSEMALANANGRITIEDVPGEVAIMVRFQGNVGVFRSIIPQGVPEKETPPKKTFIDNLVFAKQRQPEIPPSQLCADAALICHISNDISGRLPTVAEV